MENSSTGRTREDLVRACAYVRRGLVRNDERREHALLTGLQGIRDILRTEARRVLEITGVDSRLGRLALCVALQRR
jgi:hypothetical protein